MSKGVTIDVFLKSTAALEETLHIGFKDPSGKAV